MGLRPRSKISPVGCDGGSHRPSCLPVPSRTGEEILTWSKKIRPWYKSSGKVTETRNLLQGGSWALGNQVEGTHFWHCSPLFLPPPSPVSVNKSSWLGDHPPAPERALSTPSPATYSEHTRSSPGYTLPSGKRIDFIQKVYKIQKADNAHCKSENK